MFDPSFRTLMVMYWWWRRHGDPRLSECQLSELMEERGFEREISECLSKLAKQGYVTRHSGFVTLTKQGMAEGSRVDT